MNFISVAFLLPIKQHHENACFNCQIITSSIKTVLIQISNSGIMNTDSDWLTMKLAIHVFGTFRNQHFDSTEWHIWEQWPPF